MNIRQLLKEKAQICVDLGKESVQGFTSLSEVNSTFDVIPWNLPDNCVDILRADNILCKISRENHRFLTWMNEAWRILKYDGQFMIVVPYGMSYNFIQDPTNINPLNESTFANFDPLEPFAGKGLYPKYKPNPWRIAHMTFKVEGILEVLLVKRYKDTSYGK